MPTLQTIEIALVLKLENAFDRQAFSGIASGAHNDGGTRLHLTNAAYLEEAIRRYNMSGFIISSGEPAWVRQISALGKPSVNIANCIEEHARVPVVGTDDAAIGAMIAQHYLERGFRSFACFTNPGVPYFFPRRDAFVQAVESAGFGCAVGPPLPTIMAGQAKPAPTWVEDAGRWLSSLPKPLALMSPWDALAREAMLACESASLRVPADVSIIGVDDDQTLCMTAWPQLSSVITPAERIGYEALRLVRRMILEHVPPPAKPLMFPPTGIVLRGSSSEIAVDDPEVAMAVDFIRVHLARSLTVEDLVERTALSRRTLERRFLAAIRRTPTDEIRRARLERAKQLLATTDLSFVEVARRSGLRRHQRLCSLFKAETGQTPLQFRDSARASATRRSS